MRQDLYGTGGSNASAVSSGEQQTSSVPLGNFRTLEETHSLRVLGGLRV